MIERSVLIVLTVALIGSLGGFFLYVPILPNLAVVVVLGGLCAMFWLGVRIGRRPASSHFGENGRQQENQLSLS